jgi:hypothetical protein
VGIARARDIQNKKPLSEETVRRMKAYFDRHEVDKKGSTWSDQGKGWQAWMGWGGDEGRTWATAIVERMNKRQQNSSTENKREFAAATEIAIALEQRPSDPNAWLNAVEAYRKELSLKADLATKPILDKPLVQFAEKKFDLPTPDVGETHDAFMARCMANPTAVSEFPDEQQRYAVCMRQHQGNSKK